MKKLIVIFGLALAIGTIGCGKSNIETVTLTDRADPLLVQLPNVEGKMMSDVQIDVADTNSPFHGVNWTFSRKFSAEDIAMAQFCVKFVEELAGVDYPENYNNLYWSDDMLTSMTNGLLGMCVYSEKRQPWRAYIGIASEERPPSLHDLNAVKDFGSTVVHEMDHAVNLTIEPLVRIKVERLIDTSFAFACQTHVTNIYPFQLDIYTNKPYNILIEKIAYDIGLFAPWEYSYDFVNEPQRPRFFMILPPPTNRFLTNMVLTNVTTTNIIGPLPAPLTNRSSTITNQNN